MPTFISMSAMRREFGLTLMVNHACNLRCSYCYTGKKFHSPMPLEVGRAAIERAFRALDLCGGLNVSFFGGEPLLESARILEWMAYARRRSEVQEKQVRFNLTTNGTLTGRDAWRVIMSDDLEVAVSFDGVKELHDRHRRTSQGRGSAATVKATLERLIATGKPVRVNTVVRPDTLGYLTDSLGHIYELGVRQVDLSLDLWTTWTANDGNRLEAAIYRAAELWRGWLPDFALNWFDTKAGALAQIPLLGPDTRCGFGEGEISVAPSGRLYPCERLIGEDAADNPFRLSGHALDGGDCFAFNPPLLTTHRECSVCMLKPVCESQCRCSNFVRSGNMSRPDGLLCLLNKATTSAVVEVLRKDGYSTDIKQKKDMLWMEKILNS